ncbi:hypothetical protein FEF09_28450 [Chitinophaga pinensis]|uniref:DUF5724 domain-containing protein n=1 Tax=Chitinophaga pinensis TaxID=79329 RepID=A0A5C6LLM8_9BACT|nr:DUF5724 domain-containing protein [Chitinophaga pinensis]TWV91993.1 hypothetical protein FEF09_28450 [Chitinophaga pinensis]
MGKTTLYKGYIYSSDSENKQQLFSTLLKRCFPLDTDTDEMFAAAMKRIKVTETRLLEAAVYAPQWQICKQISQLERAGYRYLVDARTY